VPLGFRARQPTPDSGIQPERKGLAPYLGKRRSDSCAPWLAPTNYNGWRRALSLRPSSNMNVFQLTGPADRSAARATRQPGPDSRFEALDCPNWRVSKWSTTSHPAPLPLVVNETGLEGEGLIGRYGQGRPAISGPAATPACLESHRSSFAGWHPDCDAEKRVGRRCSMTFSAWCRGRTEHGRERDWPMEWGGPELRARPLGASPCHSRHWRSSP